MATAAYIVPAPVLRRFNTTNRRTIARMQIGLGKENARRSLVVDYQGTNLFGIPRCQRCHYHHRHHRSLLLSRSVGMVLVLAVVVAKQPQRELSRHITTDAPLQGRRAQERKAKIK